MRGCLSCDVIIIYFCRMNSASVTGNTLVCDQSNVYSLHVIFSSISPHLLFILSFLTVGPLVILTCKITAQSPVICVNRHYIV